jgi:hypothetical protein
MRNSCSVSPNTFDFSCLILKITEVKLTKAENIRIVHQISLSDKPKILTFFDVFFTNPNIFENFPNLGPEAKPKIKFLKTPNPNLKSQILETNRAPYCSGFASLIYNEFFSQVYFKLRHVQMWPLGVSWPLCLRYF